MQGLVQSTWDEASKSLTIKVGLKEGEPILIQLIQAVEDMTQGSLGLLLFKAFNLLNDLFYQLRISGLEEGLVAKLLQRGTVHAGVFLEEWVLFYLRF